MFGTPLQYSGRMCHLYRDLWSPQEGILTSSGYRLIPLFYEKDLLRS